MAIFDDVKNALTNAAQSVSNKTKDSMEIQRLTNESRNAANELAGTYSQLGRTYVDTDGEINDTIDSLLSRAKELRTKITSLEKQKMALRNQRKCPSCSAIMGKSANFCSNCGTRMPEIETPVVREPEPANITYCPSCGAMKKNSDPYCEVCGYCFETDDEPLEEAAVEEVIIAAPVTGVSFNDAPDVEDEIPETTDAE